MDKQRASALVALLKSFYPQAYFPQESAAAYVSVFCAWNNESAAYEAVRQLIDTETALPPIATIRDAYRRIDRAHREQRALTEQTDVREAVIVGPTPEWVHVWAWLRLSKDDYRAMPQQNDGLALPEPHAISHAEYKRLQEEWTAAGAPTAHKLLGMPHAS